MTLQPTDRVKIDPLLGLLADNGGSTWTHVPQVGSLALDAIPGVPVVATDQRGVSRPQNVRLTSARLNWARNPTGSS